MEHRKTFSLPASPSFSSSSPRSPTPSCTFDFVELLARSNFSFLQGASHPEELVLRAQKLGYRGLSICDVNGLYGIVKGYQVIEKPSFFDVEQLALTNEDGTPQRPFQYICGAELTPHNASPVTLIPMNKSGYVTLSRLLTLAKRRAPKAHIVIDLNEILEKNENLLAIPLPPWKEADLKKLQRAFQDRLYLPVCKDFTWESIRLYQQAVQFERNLGIPLFATQRPLFHEPSRKPLHDVLTCILHKTTLAEANLILTPNAERHLKPLTDLAHLYRERPDLLTRTCEIASRIDFSLKELRYRYPREHLPPGKSASEHLKDLAEKGLPKRYPSDQYSPEFLKKVRGQLARELGVIQRLEYEDYFLTLHELCQFAEEKKILHQGRGSAANSIVCFVLGLTSIDPIRFQLLFERFLSEERAEPPDIDIDFEHERREEVIQHIYKKYGAARAAMVCTVIRYRSRMAVREVAKVLDIPFDKIEKLIKSMGREGLRQLAESGSPSEIEKSKFRLLIQLTAEIQDFPRHLGIHSGGFVIAHEPLVDIVPVESATMEDRYVIQWNKDDIAVLGLMKIDVLALGMLTAIKKTFALLETHQHVKLDLTRIPPDHVPTYEMIQKADTVGVFQIESRAQMSLLPRLKPTEFYHLVISVAIVRPGPIQGGLVHPFLKRKSGREKITYAHESLIPILKKTFGVPLFQEQVMQIAVTAANFSPGEADELRRVISSAWKKKHIMAGLRQRVISGMLTKGLSREYAEQIYRTIEGFSSYGFPESHAASFALLTYASCYLKQNHQDAFVCALLNSQPMGFYSPRQLVSDAQRRGVRFLPLCIQQSIWDFSLEKSTNESGYHAVRAGFRAVFGVKEESIDQLVKERAARGPFLDLGDLVRRTQLPRACLMRITAAGALADLNSDARQMIWALQAMSFDEESLFFGHTQGLDTERTRSEQTLIPPENPWEEVRREYQSQGFSIDRHPLGVLRPHLAKSRKRYTTAHELTCLRHRTPIVIAGLKSLVQKPPTAKGMCFVSLEDETGFFNVVITPDLYEKIRLTLFNSTLIEVEGFLESREGVRNVKARELRALELAAGL